MLGFAEPDPAGVILGTGMMRFNSPFGINGLCEESSDHQEINILVVVATKPGTGQLRSFIQHCKQNYSTVRVLEIWNPGLHKALIRYGFSETKWTDRFGEKLSAMEWKRP